MKILESRTLSDKFMLRLPDGMRDRIKAAAEANNRSMNSEIVATLEEAYPEPLNSTEQELYDLLLRMSIEDARRLVEIMQRAKELDEKDRRAFLNAELAKAGIALPSP
jgi:hypothetical protein